MWTFHSSFRSTEEILPNPLKWWQVLLFLLAAQPPSSPSLLQWQCRRKIKGEEIKVSNMAFLNPSHWKTGWGIFSWEQKSFCAIEIFLICCVLIVHHNHRTLKNIRLPWAQTEVGQLRIVIKWITNKGFGAFCTEYLNFLQHKLSCKKCAKFKI